MHRTFDLSPEKLAEVEARLQAEIRWAVDAGPGWDPYVGATYDGDEGWVAEPSVTPGRLCGVCAVGALCVRLGRTATIDSQVTAAAEELGVPRRWVATIFSRITDPVPENPGDTLPQAVALAHRLRAYGDAYAAAHPRPES